MTIRIALTHRLDLRYQRRVRLDTHWLRLRPAPPADHRIEAYSLQVRGEPHFLNWVRDPYENHLARLDLPEPIDAFGLDVELIFVQEPINPFDFLLESSAASYPFSYSAQLTKELAPYLRIDQHGRRFAIWLAGLEMATGATLERLAELNLEISRSFSADPAGEPGAIDLEQMLARGAGSPWELAWLLTLSLRRLGLAARFVSGYRVLLGPVAADLDMAALHAWSEVYLPGAGWVGLDPANGVFVAEGHIPLACAPEPQHTLPIAGGQAAGEPIRSQEIRVRRLSVANAGWPYGDSDWATMRALGAKIDADLDAQALRLSMGVSLSFVAVHDTDAAEWTTAALGPGKLRAAKVLLNRLRARIAQGGVFHSGQAEWFAGEGLPRWSLSCFFRTDGYPVWSNAELHGGRQASFNLTTGEAQRFAELLAVALGLSAGFVMAAHEDGLHELWSQGADLDFTPSAEDLCDPERRRLLAARLSTNHSEPAGFVLPLRWNPVTARWHSGSWRFRRECLYLLPGDSPMGFRLPLEGLPVGEQAAFEPEPPRCQFEERALLAESCGEVSARFVTFEPDAGVPEIADPDTVDECPPRTAICVQVRQGQLYVFLPPLTHLEHYLELVAAVETAAGQLGTPVMLEGYQPPEDYRLQQLQIYPEAGTLKLSLPETGSWSQQMQLIEAAYEEAERCGLRAERRLAGGECEPPGGRAEIRLGGRQPAASPFLCRPGLLRSLIVYWQRHPSLSYLFGGRAIGAGGAAPRPDEGRDDALYELGIALQRMSAGENPWPWTSDRLLRHLLADPAGDMGRAEIRVDLLYPPGRSDLRLGKILLRSFETPPDARMAALQLLLVGGLLAHSGRSPQTAELIEWDAALGDRFMLPQPLWDDFRALLRELEAGGYPFRPEWFEPFLQWHFPLLGSLQLGDIGLELRRAHEPWPLLAEETTAGGVARFVDSANGRLQVSCSGLTPSRHILVCNGHGVPLRATGVKGAFVAGVRFKSANPPSTLHPSKPPLQALVFDLVDGWTGRVIGGCTYYPPRPQLSGPAGLPAGPGEPFEARAPERSLRPPPVYPTGSSGGVFLPTGSGLARMSPPSVHIDPRQPYLLDLVRL